MKNDLKKVAIVGGTSTLLLATLAAAGFAAVSPNEPRNMHVLMVGPREEDFELKAIPKKKKKPYSRIPPKSLGRKSSRSKRTPKHDGYY